MALVVAVAFARRCCRGPWSATTMVHCQADTRAVTSFNPLGDAKYSVVKSEMGTLVSISNAHALTEMITQYLL